MGARCSTGVRGPICGSPGGSGRGGALGSPSSSPGSSLGNGAAAFGGDGSTSVPVEVGPATSSGPVRSGTGKVRANKVPVNGEAQPFRHASRVGRPYTGRMRTVLWLVVAGAVVIATVLALQTRFGSLSAQPTSTAGPALDEIRGDSIAAHLQFLSDDLLEGRAPSTRGGQLAGKYLASQLALLGFEPAGDNGSYFQDVAIVESVVKPSFTLAAGTGPRFTYLKDVVAFSDIQEPKVEASGEIVFVGHGIVAPAVRRGDGAMRRPMRQLDTPFVEKGVVADE